MSNTFESRIEQFLSACIHSDEIENLPNPICEAEEYIKEVAIKIKSMDDSHINKLESVRENEVIVSDTNGGIKTSGISIFSVIQAPLESWSDIDAVCKMGAANRYLTEGDMIEDDSDPKIRFSVIGVSPTEATLVARDNIGGFDIGVCTNAIFGGYHTVASLNYSPGDKMGIIWDGNPEYFDVYILSVSINVGDELDYENSGTWGYTDSGYALEDCDGVEDFYGSTYDLNVPPDDTEVALINALKTLSPGLQAVIKTASYITNAVAEDYPPPDETALYTDNSYYYNGFFIDLSDARACNAWAYGGVSEVWNGADVNTGEYTQKYVGICPIITIGGNQ